MSLPEEGVFLAKGCGKSLVDGKAALYVCHNFTCQAPVTTPDAVEALIDAPSNRQESI